MFEQLCKEKGITPTQAARENDITQQAVSLWKRRGSIPKVETLQKLADYFEVSISHLLGLDVPMTEKDRLQAEGHFLAFELNKLRIAMQEEGTSPNEIKMLEKFCAESTETMWDYVPGILFEFQIKHLDKEIGPSALISVFEKLNSLGQQEAIKRVEELTEIPKYRRQEPPEAPQPTPPDGTPTPGSSTEGPQEPPEGK